MVALLGLRRCSMCAALSARPLVAREHLTPPVPVRRRGAAMWPEALVCRHPHCRSRRLVQRPEALVGRHPWSGAVRHLLPGGGLAASPASAAASLLLPDSGRWRWFAAPQPRRLQRRGLGGGRRGHDSPPSDLQVGRRRGEALPYP